ERALEGFRDSSDGELLGREGELVAALRPSHRADEAETREVLHHVREERLRHRVGLGHAADAQPSDRARTQRGGFCLLDAREVRESYESVIDTLGEVQHRRPREEEYSILPVRYQRP